MLRLQVALFFADGRAYFTGIGLMLLAIALSIPARPRWTGRVSRLSVIFGAAMIILSSTPLPLWFYASWLVVTVAWFVERSYRAKRLPNWLVSGTALAACVVAAATEMPRRQIPVISTNGPMHVYVIGDSLSAGIGHNERTWPKVLNAPGRIDVVDLSRAGETVSSAMVQARQVQPGPAIVLIEIGGNDLLGSTSTAEYTRGLRQLLDALHSPSRQLVMFELPLPPFSNGYGRVQRSLAAEYSIPLIPKRVLAGVIGSSDTTLDGLHLSEPGHLVIAAIVRGVLGGRATSVPAAD